MQLQRLCAHTPANEAADSTKSVSTEPDARNQPDWCRDSTTIQYLWTGEALAADLVSNLQTPSRTLVGCDLESGCSRLGLILKKILRKILRIIIIIIYYPWAVYCEGPPSFIWRGKGRREEEGQTNWGTHFQRLRPEEFSSWDFGLRSFGQLVISTWAEIMCPVKFNKAGPWEGGGEGGGEGRGG